MTDKISLKSEADYRAAASLACSQQYLFNSQTAYERKMKVPDTEIILKHQQLRNIRTYNNTPIKFRDEKNQECNNISLDDSLERPAKTAHEGLSVKTGHMSSAARSKGHQRTVSMPDLSSKGMPSEGVDPHRQSKNVGIFAGKLGGMGNRRPSTNQKQSGTSSPKSDSRRPSYTAGIPELIDVFNGDFKEMLYKYAMKTTLQKNLAKRVKMARSYGSMKPRLQTIHQIQEKNELRRTSAVRFIMSNKTQESINKLEMVLENTGRPREMRFGRLLTLDNIFEVAKKKKSQKPLSPSARNKLPVPSNLIPRKYYHSHSDEDSLSSENSKISIEEKVLAQTMRSSTSRTPSIKVWPATTLASKTTSPIKFKKLQPQKLRASASTRQFKPVQTQTISSSASTSQLKKVKPNASAATWTLKPSHSVFDDITKIGKHQEPVRIEPVEIPKQPKRRAVTRLDSRPKLMVNLNGTKCPYTGVKTTRQRIKRIKLGKKSKSTRNGASSNPIKFF